MRSHLQDISRVQFALLDSDLFSHARSVASGRASYGLNFAPSIGILRSPVLLRASIILFVPIYRASFESIRKPARTGRTMSIPKLRQVCEGDARSGRRQMVAVLSTLCIGSRLNKFSAYYYTKYIYSRS